MPYMTGEMPKVGDRVKDKQWRLATVISVLESGIVVRWDQGVVEIEYPNANDFELVERASS
jgi:hypothetical protein